MEWQSSLSSLPPQPGVYWFLNAAANNQVLYVGKAKNLKKRVKSYTQLRRLSLHKQEMVQQATHLKFKVLESEMEALLIEAELIRLHQPEYNVLLKDDKSPIYVQITDDLFPQLNLVRKRDIIKRNLDGTILGPFHSAYKLRQVLKIARRIFPWCDKTAERIKKNLKPEQAYKKLKTYDQACFYYHLDLCPGACVGKISPQNYADNINNLVLFLRGKKKTVLHNLEQKMQKLADELKFEQAAQVKHKIDLINDVTSKKYRLKPDLILPALHDNANRNALDHLRKILIDVTDLPRQYRLKRIEAYDVSNIMGQNAAVSMVCFNHGLPDKKNYRLFNIRGLDTPNDYQMLQEAIRRRQKHPEWGRPNLVVIDGGKGQIRAALTVWDWAAPVIGIVKNPDRLVVPSKIFTDKKTNRLKINYEILRLPDDHPTLHLIQQIRDESHRFAKKQHTKLRREKLIT
jgi:excinuclease ABC subunit C